MILILVLVFVVWPVVYFLGTAYLGWREITRPPPKGGDR